MVLSPKHGVNPTIPVCFYCNKEKNELLLVGRMKDDRQAPMRAVWDLVPCEECKKYMEAGIILISVRNGESGNNPYRTGGWVVITEEAFKRIFSGDAAQKACEKRVCFIEDETWNRLELPRG